MIRRLVPGRNTSCFFAPREPARLTGQRPNVCSFRVVSCGRSRVQERRDTVSSSVGGIWTFRNGSRLSRYMGGTTDVDRTFLLRRPSRDCTRNCDCVEYVCVCVR
jgi:hypothetical protein